MQHVRSFIFTAYLFLSAAVTCPFIALAGVFPRKYRLAIAISWANSIMWVLKKTCRLDYQVEGIENLPDDPTVVMLKHSSAWETVSIFCIFGNQNWVLKRELMWMPVLGWALFALNPIAINRNAGTSAVSQVVEQGADRIARGMRVIIFPEGTRMPRGQTRRYGLSGVLLAQKAGTPVVPVAHNAGDFWARRGLLKKPGTVRLVIGPPIDVTGLDPRIANERIQTWVERKMQEISSAY